MPEKAVIAVDAAPAVRSSQTGTERFTREVVRRLPKLAADLDWRFYAPSDDAGLGVPIEVIPPGRLWTQVRLRSELARSRPDLFVAIGHVVPDFLPVPAYKVFHDLAFERFPEAYPALARAYLRHTERSAARRCVRMAAVSEATKRDLVDLFGVPPSRVDVVHEGGGERRAPVPADPDRLAELGLTRPFALHVGRIEPRKNQASAAAAAAAAGVDLACVGAVQDRVLAARLRAAPGCHLLGSLADADRDLLYSSALALVFPSLYEGFGLPLVEAMAHGLPVIVPRTSSLPEVAGQAALYVRTPLDVQGMADWLTRLGQDGDLKQKCAAEGRARAGLFTWDRCAAELAESIRKAVAELSSGGRRR